MMVMNMSQTTARLATAPLDLIRIRMQLSAPTASSGIGGTASSVEYPLRSSFSLWSQLKEIVQKEGSIFALFRGNLAATYLWAGYAMVQFAVYGRLQQIITAAIIPENATTSSKDGKNEIHNLGQRKTVVAFLSGAVAGTCATLITYPFDLCRTAFAARGLADTIPAATPKATRPHLQRPPTSIAGFAADIYRNQGVRGFYAGGLPAVLQIVPYMGLNFSIYEYLTRQDHNKTVSVSGYAGSIAGATSKIVVYPMDTVKKRLQAQAVFGTSTLHSSASHPHVGMVDCARAIYKREGVASFYRGIVPAVLKNMIGTGLSFAIFRATKNVLEGRTEAGEGELS
uniref:Uncharacterized protein n=1 Tax=Craspedostauros australis TaxID=1486917 RepID=A0A7R9ZR81_9STRA